MTFLIRRLKSQDYVYRFRLFFVLIFSIGLGLCLPLCVLCFAFGLIFAGFCLFCEFFCALSNFDQCHS